MTDLSRLSCLGEALRYATVTFKSNVALVEADRKREGGRWNYRELRAEAELAETLVLLAPLEDGAGGCWDVDGTDRGAA